MKSIRKLFTGIIAMLLFSLGTYAQHNGTSQNKVGTAIDSVPYPNVNTPNHNAVTPNIKGTFDNPKIADTSKVGNEINNWDSIKSRERTAPNPDGKYPDPRGKDIPK